MDETYQLLSEDQLNNIAADLMLFYMILQFTAVVVDGKNVIGIDNSNEAHWIFTYDTEDQLWSIANGDKL